MPKDPEPVPETTIAETFDLPTLAAEFKQLAPAAPDGGKYLWRHNVASFLHSWGPYEYHSAKPVLLSKADYKAALDAVDTETIHFPAVRKA